MSLWENEIAELNNLADLRRKQGEMTEAESLFKQAIGLILAFGATPSNEAAVYSNYGLLLNHIGNMATL